MWHRHPPKLITRLIIAGALLVGGSGQQGECRSRVSLAAEAAWKLHRKVAF
jgi:hypothetical protein